MKRFLTSMIYCMLATGLIHAQQAYSGIQAFQDIRDGYLLVRLPGYTKKLATIDSLLAQPELSERSVELLQEERQRTITTRDLIQKWYPLAFDSMYTFSRVAFIDNDDTELFEKGSIHALSASGEPITGLNDHSYIIATLYGQFGGPFKFRTADHISISPPMPEEVGLPEYLAWFSSLGPWPVWVRENNDSQVIRTVYLHVQRLNKKFEKTYERWVVTASEG